MSTQGRASTLPHAALEEGRKLLAFLRRDLLVAWSYRVPFLTDWLSLLLQTLVFVYVGRLIPPAALPMFDGRTVDYLEYVAVGITLSSFLAVGLTRVTTAVRQEQLQGTLEVLLLTPTAWSTIQIGSAIYDVLYVPIRTGVFLALTVVFFGASYETSGILPAFVVLVAFIPFVWGLGIASAAATVTFRRGSGGIGFFTTIATLGSGAFFPIDVLPSWAQSLARVNPIAVAVEGMRSALLGGSTLGDLSSDLIRLVPMSAIALVLGAAAFRLAIGRERRKGTLGLY